MMSFNNVDDIFEILVTHPSSKDKHICKICRGKFSNPRVLSCLHVICQECLDKRLQDESSDKKISDSILCPECLQETKISICDECGISEVASHLSCKRWKEALPKHLEELENLLVITKAKSAQFHGELDALENACTTLHKQYDDAEQVVLQKYKNYRATLKNWKEESIQELRHWRIEQESKLNDSRFNLEKICNEVDDLCKITHRVLKNGSSLEILSLKDVVSRQLVDVTTYTPDPAVDFSPEFKTTVTAFEKSVQDVTASDSKTAVLSKGTNLQNAKTKSNLRGTFSGRNESFYAMCAKSRPQWEVYGIPRHTQAVERCVKTGGMPRRNMLVIKTVHDGLMRVTNNVLHPESSVSSGTLSTASSVSSDSQDKKYRQMKVALIFGRTGSSEGEFNNPRDVCLGWEDDIVVADSLNHRVQIFDRHGMFKCQFGKIGTADGNFYNPTKIACFRDSGYLIVGDCGYVLSRLQIFTKDGHFVRKIPIGGIIEVLAGLAVTRLGNIVAVDQTRPAIYVISQNGEVLFRCDGAGHLMEPCAVTFLANEFFVCDLKGSAVVVFGVDGTYLRTIKRQHEAEWRPTSIDVSNVGLVVGDSDGSRFHAVAFTVQGHELFAYECPIKVLRCSGLKITSDGNVITLATTENYVLAVK